MAFTGYGDQSKRQRRLARKAFGAPTIPSYHPFLLSETHSFLRCLTVDSTQYVKHIRRYAGGLTLSVVYGYEAVSNEDKFLKLAEECVDLLANRIAAGGGIWPVDIFPFLRHIPLWMPGSGFKRNAIVWKKKMEEFVDRPFEYVKASMVSLSFKLVIIRAYISTPNRNLAHTNLHSAQHSLRTKVAKPWTNLNSISNG